jgi:hypothetical protein
MIRVIWKQLEKQMIDGLGFADVNAEETRGLSIAHMCVVIKSDYRGTTDKSSYMCI